MCIFSYYWIDYIAPGCIIVHLPLTIVGVCVDPVMVGQVYAGGVDRNVHLRSPVSTLRERLPGILLHVSES